MYDVLTSRYIPAEWNNQDQRPRKVWNKIKYYLYNKIINNKKFVPVFSNKLYAVCEEDQGNLELLTPWSIEEGLD